MGKSDIDKLKALACRVAQEFDYSQFTFQVNCDGLWHLNMGNVVRANRFDIVAFLLALPHCRVEASAR